jgi:hypothetical protein
MVVLVCSVFMRAKREAASSWIGGPCLEKYTSEIEEPTSSLENFQDPSLRHE